MLDDFFCRKIQYAIEASSRFKILNNFKKGGCYHDQWYRKMV